MDWALKTALNASGTHESAANTAQKFNVTCSRGSYIAVKHVSVFIRAAAAVNDTNCYLRAEVADGSAYTYTDGTGVVSAMTFTKGSLSDVAVGDLFVDDGALTTLTAISAVDSTTLTITSGLSATYNGGAFTIYRPVWQGLIGAGAPRGDGFSVPVEFRGKEGRDIRFDIDAAGASVITVGNLLYRVVSSGS